MNKILNEDFNRLLNEYSETFKQLRGAKILITGSTGMITTYLARFLCFCAKKFDLELFLQCRSIKKAERLYTEFLQNNYLHIVSFNLESGEEPSFKADYIIHAASLASTKHFIQTPVDVIKSNTLGTYYLLNYAKKIGIKKLLFFSSNSIYGEGGVNKTVLEEHDLGIVDPLGERSCYIESKRLGEQMCAAFYRQYGVNSSIIRICHTYGPTFDIENDARIIPRVIKQILNGEDVTVYKDPNSVIQYTYIADIVGAVLLVLLKGECACAYNAGSDELVKIDEVIELMVKAAPQSKSKLIKKPIDDNYNFSKGKGVNFVKLSNKKLQGLGWKQLFSNREGFKRTVQSYLENNR